MKKQFLVIGLGRFGESIARELADHNAEVMVVDVDEDKVNHSVGYATQSVMMDATDEQALDTLNVGNFDVVCVCIGAVEPSILITLLCKERGVKKVISKASSELHANVLRKVGASYTVFPEKDGGARLARNLVSSNILDLIELSPEYSIAEFMVHGGWAGKSILELDFRKKYGLSIVAIRNADQGVNISPLASDVLQKGEIVVVIGPDEQIGKLEELTHKTK